MCLERQRLLGMQMERKGACLVYSLSVVGQGEGKYRGLSWLLLRGQGQGEEWSVTMGPERCTGVRLGERVV